MQGFAQRHPRKRDAMRNEARLFNPSTFYADQLLNETAIGFSTTERLEILNSNYIPLEVKITLSGSFHPSGIIPVTSKVGVTIFSFDFQPVLVGRYLGQLEFKFFYSNILV
ncbi:hypothetical protein DAPPUDRAFT_329805 [Daphnia pulex]|uniref:Uncharacterized protein n=1 Tax=Daphnia pulex TaxID=6669 RepID=E9HHN9_DAPPU|nr:hypothetical protein DAPPUDRAFT_329805 [Daphnia pulex]|eukprot:EFX68737.1 hypothetical protein DAPPUDRAFT_329805 [Daphnia pulex]